MHTLTLNGQILGRGGDDRLELVFQRAAILCFCLAQLRYLHHFALQRIPPLRRNLFSAHLRTVVQASPTDGAEERREKRVFPRARVTAEQHRVVDLYIRMLHLMREHVQQVFAFVLLRHHTVQVR